MKKIISIIICILMVVSLAACGGQNANTGTSTPESGEWDIEGYFHNTNNGVLVIRAEAAGNSEELIYEPIVIKNADEFDLSELDNGDLIRLSIDRIEETYPAMTNMYGFELLEKNSAGYINCAETINQLIEMGYSPASKASQVQTGINVFAENNMKLGMNILGNAMEQDHGKNVLISPVSLYEALALLAYGTDGKTKDELLRNVLGQDIEPVNKNIQHFNNSVIPDSITIANSIWFNQDYTHDVELNWGYVEIAQKTFSAEVKKITYDDSGAEEVNGWVSDNTHQMIPKIVDKLSPDEVMHLINALAFESEWLIPYEEDNIIEGYTFEGIEGETQKDQKVNMLISHNEMCTVITDDQDTVIADVFRKPYADGRTAFIGILPSEGYTPEDVVKTLTGERYREMCNGFMVSPDMTAGIPEYSLDYSIEMTEILKELGMQTAFTDEADLSGMANTKETPLYVGGVLQKTHIEVDRMGTKAAAVTDITVKANGLSTTPPKEIILNRPFVYMIVDIDTNMPYFIGVQYDCDK